MNVLGLGQNKYGRWFFYKHGKVGKGSKWTPLQEYVCGVTDDQKFMFELSGIKPDWIEVTD